MIDTMLYSRRRRGFNDDHGDREYQYVYTRDHIQRHVHYHLA